MSSEKFKMGKRLTIRELRETIKYLPDDMKVELCIKSKIEDDLIIINDIDIESTYLSEQLKSIRKELEFCYSKLSEVMDKTQDIRIRLKDNIQEREQK